MPKLAFQDGKFVKVDEGIGVGPECCCSVPPPSGACCILGACYDVQSEQECNGYGGIFIPYASCDKIECVVKGSCCFEYLGSPFCIDGFPIGDIPPAENCGAFGGVYYPDVDCIDITCCLKDGDCPNCQCCEDKLCQEGTGCVQTFVNPFITGWCGTLVSNNPSFNSCPPLGGDIYSYIEVSNDPIQIITCGFDYGGEGLPAKDPNLCRYVYSVAIWHGRGTNLTYSDSCYAKSYLAYFDMDPCAPGGGNATLVEIPGSAIEMFGDCLECGRAAECNEPVVAITILPP